MKHARLLFVPLMLGLLTLTASAEDGAVPKSTLSSLGLGQMQVISDVAGMEVRGKSSSATATSLSLFSAVLFDPISGSSVTATGSSFDMATDQNAGLNVVSSATVTTGVGISASPLTLTVGGFTGTVSLFTAGGNGVAMSP